MIDVTNLKLSLINLVYFFVRYPVKVLPLDAPASTWSCNKGVAQKPRHIIMFIIPYNKMKIFDWLIRIQHLECYCQQIFQSTTSGFTVMNSNVKDKSEQWLTPWMHNNIRCCTSKCKSRFRCCTFERRSRCNETLVMHECFKCRGKSRVQCVNPNYVPIKLFEIQIELFNWLLHGHKYPRLASSCWRMSPKQFCGWPRGFEWLTSTCKQENCTMLYPKLVRT